MSLLPLSDAVAYRTEYVNNKRTLIDDATGTKHISIDGDGGLDIRYDIGTANVKNFKISSAGVNWTDNTNNHTTGLERLALVQTAFSAVELPPNTTTLKVNNTLLLDAGVATQSTTIEDGKITINNASVGGASNPLLVLQNNNTTAGATTFETYKNDLPTSTGGDTIASWSATCNTNIGKTEIARINQIAYGVGASNNDGGIALACKVNSTISTFLTCNGGAGSGEIQITKPITNPTGDIDISVSASSGTGDIKLIPKSSTGAIKTDGKITNLATTGGNLIDFANGGADSKFTIDRDTMELFWNDAVSETSTITIDNDLVSKNNAINQLYTTATGNLNTTIQNNPSFHRLYLQDTINARDAQLSTNALVMNNSTNSTTMTLDNNVVPFENRISLAGADQTTPYFNAIDIVNRTSSQIISLRNNGATSSVKQLTITNNSPNTAGATINYQNELDTNPLTITTNQDLDLISTKAGGFINMTSVSSIDIEATGDNLTLTGGAVIQLETTGVGADIIIKPETTAGNLVFEGTNLQSSSSGGNSGQHLRIKLNGTYYKIKLEDDT
jgi:hypothetical protein